MALSVRLRGSKKLLPKMKPNVLSLIVLALRQPVLRALGPSLIDFAHARGKTNASSLKIESVVKVQKNSGVCSVSLIGQLKDVIKIIYIANVQAF